MGPVNRNGKGDIGARIEELKRKISLSESKKKASYEEGEEAKVKNEEYSIEIKEEIDKLKQQAVGSKTEFLNIIWPMKSLLLQQKKTEQVIQLVDQWIYDLRKQHNLIVHQEKQNKERICQLKTRKQELLKIVEAPQDVSDNQEFVQEFKRIQELENNSELLQMKTTEAELVQKKYLSVRAVMEDEILQIQKDINSLDESIAKAKNELPHLVAIVQNAEQSSKMIETQLVQQDRRFNKQKYCWEKAIMMCNQEVDDIHYLETSEEEKTADMLQSSADVNSFEEFASSAAVGGFANLSRDLLQHMKLTAGTDKEEFAKLLEQKETKQRLDEIQHQFNQKIMELQEEKEKLEMEIEREKLTKEQEANTLFEELQLKLEEECQRKTQTLQVLDDQTHLVEELHAVLRQLCIKILQGCKLPSGSTTSPSPDNALDLLMTCIERVDMLVEQCKDCDRSSATKMYQGIKYNKNVEEAQSILKPKKRTQQLDEPSLVTSKSRDVDNTTTDHEILTRAMVKRQAKLMIDQHNKQLQKGSRGQKKTRE